MGRASEITRDELNFNKFIVRLRNKFSNLFDQLLETQLVLKGVINKKQWKNLRENIRYDFNTDNHFTEMKEVEIFRERITLANDIDPFVGRFVSNEYVHKKVFRMSEEEIEKEKKQIKKEKNSEDEPTSLTQQGIDMQQQQQDHSIETDKDQAQAGVAKTPDEQKAKKEAEKNEEDKKILTDLNRILKE